MERHLVGIALLVITTTFKIAEANSGTIQADGTMACERTCDRFCPNGYLSDSCPRCTCAPDPCESRTFPSDTICQRIETDCGFSRACPMTAVCESRTSPVCQTTCAIQCEYGFEAVGCPRCTCAENPCLTANCPLGSQCMTKPTSCKFQTFCPHFAMCMSQPCAAVTTTECRFGLLPVGCPRSKCAADPCLSTRCASGSACRAVPSNCAFGVECPYVGVCEQALCAATVNKVCTFGFTMRGCPRSECATDPCLSKTCPAGESCFLQNGTCPFAENCPLEAVCQPSACDATLNIKCMYGFKPQGCPRSECADDPCAANPCATDEECFARHTDCGFSSDCPYVADCRPRVCRDVLPNLACDFGYQLSGCPRNLCAPNPCDTVTCPFGQECVITSGTCPFDVECPVSHQCVTRECSEVLPADCRFGVEETGCPRSTCAADPCLTANCTPDQVCITQPSACTSGIQCPHEAICSRDVCSDVAPNIQCTFGFESIGCPRVQCAPNPCESVNCPVGQSCFAEPADCPMGTFCPFDYQCRDNNCGEITPNIKCEFGFQLQGCPRDQCAPNPCEGVTCPNGQSCFAEHGDCSFGIACPYVRRCVNNDCADVLPIDCRFGMLEAGCPRGTCAPDPCRTRTCSPGLVCRTRPSQCGFRIKCPHIAVCEENYCADVAVNTCRYGVMETGCPRSTCAPDPCQAKRCESGATCSSRPTLCGSGIECPHEAICAASVCAAVADNVQCSFGFMSVGCPRSQCAPNPCLSTTCPSGQSCVAEPGTCPLGTNCPYRPKCQPNDCDEVMANLKCPFGVLPTGCPRSTCAPNPCDEGFPCAPGQSCFAERGTCSQGIDCPYVRKCVNDNCAETLRISCKYGITEIGCPRSTCAPDPCLSRNCGAGRTCNTRPSQCRFRTECPHEAVCVQEDCARVAINTCRFGVLETGCPRRTCAPDPCRTRTCEQGRSCSTRPSNCRFGTDCPHESFCTESVCAAVADNVQCSFGFMSVGCPRSQCAPNPCLSTTCPSGQSCVAEPGTCPLGTNCPYRSKCQLNDCNEVMANLKCEFGVLTSGCPRSTCAPNPCDEGFPCPPGQSCFAERGSCAQRIECPYVRKCVANDCADTLRISCPFGILESGCPRSTCAPDPCLSRNCGAGRICNTRPSQCRFRNSCPHEAVCVREDCADVAINTCRYGVLETGCPRSRCAPDPCLTKQCDPGASCSSRRTQCRFAVDCPHEAVCVASVCAAVADNVQCNFGFMSVGCPRSQCAPNPCLSVTCPSGQTCVAEPGSCPLGTNCPYRSKCQANDCNDVMPNLKCAFGVLPTGCPRSTCAPNPCEEGFPCPPGQSCFAERGICAQRIDCPYVRQCVANDCADTLRISCRYGILESGCPRSTCAPDPCLGRNCGEGRVCKTQASECRFGNECPHEAICVLTECRDVLNLNCMYGFLDTGCPRDTCSPNPCIGLICPQGKVCTTRASKCRFQSNCPHKATCTDAVCSAVVSNMECPFGFLPIGCPRNECAPNPCEDVRCPADQKCVAVMYQCELGNDCPYRHECRPNSCAEVVPNMPCEFGFLPEGCPRYKCASNPCTNVTCPEGERCIAEAAQCALGVECPRVKNCVPSNCAEVMPVSCLYGVLETGCPRSSCAPDPCLTANCGQERRCTTRPTQCLYGNECPHEAVCAALDCQRVSDVFCPFGVMEKGCPRITCALDPCLNETCGEGQRCTTQPSQCPFAVECPHEAVCIEAACDAVSASVFCPYGVLEIGCPRSSCAPNPCMGKDCGAGRKCVSTPSTCRFQTSCPHVGFCTESDCQEVAANVQCPYGVLLSGCPRATCAPNPCEGAPCPAGQTCVVEPAACAFETQCPYVRRCAVSDCGEVLPLSCPFGVELTGCPRNRCAPNPCDGFVCGSGRKCVSKRSTCQYEAECPYVAECVDMNCADVLPIACPFGIMERGCPRDTCASDPCSGVTCQLGQTCVAIPADCPSGTNCPFQSRCQQTNCRDVLPNVNCDFGFSLTGCPRDTCAPNPCDSFSCPVAQTCFARPGDCVYGLECPYVSECVDNACEDSINIFCPFGFASEGCPRRTCAADPCLSRTCPSGQTCFAKPGNCRFQTNCPYESDCRTEVCQATLALNCDYGFKNIGCPRRECADDPCTGRTCPVGQTCFAKPGTCQFQTFCPFESECRVAVCEDTLPVFCEFGFQNVGCPRRECADNPCNSRSCPTGQTCFAKPGTCPFQTNCPYVSECRARVCEDTAAVFCEFGFQNTGCPRRECADNPCSGRSCPPGQTCYAKPGTCQFQTNCPFEYECRAEVCEEILPLSCQFGFKSIGCPRRECADDPCQTQTCPAGEKCFARQGTCQFQTNCPFLSECRAEVCEDTLAVSCQFGFKSLGCPRRECADDPCTGRTCPIGERCFAKHATCQFLTNCPYGWECRAEVCEETMPISCEFGFKSIGCPRRECADNPCLITSCIGDLQCFAKLSPCEFREGCPYVAECQPSVCRETLPLNCPFGFLEEGCPRHTCAPDPCMTTVCRSDTTCTSQPLQCRFGDNCQHEGVCVDINCGDVLPNLQCDYGVKLTGCPRNACAPNPCEGNPCPTGQTCFVEPGTCSAGVQCPFVRRCVSNECGEVLSVSCPFGILEQGCPRSLCAPDPCLTTTCPDGETCSSKPALCRYGIFCPYEAACISNDCAQVMAITCQYGILESGCPRNQCAPDPCQLLTCGEGQTCTTRPSPCRFAISCPHEAVCVDTVCEDVAPNVQCLFGFESIGCPRVQCAANPCTRINCPTGSSCVAKPGNCTMQSNCPFTFTCQENDCRDVLPNIICLFGVELTGCPRSQCAPNPCEGNPCPAGQSCVTEPGQCDYGIQCPYIRRCVANDCADVAPISCPWGFVEQGCPRTTCAPDPCQGQSCGIGRRCTTRPSQCRYGNCPHEFTCVESDCREVLANFRCDYGFQLTGCPRATCAPNPCEGRPCPVGQTCFAEPGQCEFGIQCPFVRRCAEQNCAQVGPVSCMYGALERGCPRTICAPNPCESRNCGPDNTCTTRPSLCQFGADCPHEAVCIQAVCRAVAANIQCAFGFESIGCPRATCSPNPCDTAVCASDQTCVAEPGNCTLGVNCPYRARCRRTNCRDVVPNISCTFGVSLTGCPRRQCAENPCNGIVCRAGQMCVTEPGQCDYGIQCPYVHRCLQEDCQEVLPISCPFGILERGCPRDTCSPDPCRDRSCGVGRKCISRPTACTFGIACPHEAVCQDAVCRDVAANVNCPFGFLSVGCPRSQCAPNPCLNMTCDVTQSCVAEPGICAMETNCPFVHRCSETVCEETIRIFCPYGFESIGCPRRRCSPDPCLTASCKADEQCFATPGQCRFQQNCPYVADCRPKVCEDMMPIPCGFGFKSTGCPRYECAEDPCRSTTCGGASVCFARNSTCEFENGCPYLADCREEVCEETLPMDCPMGFKSIGCPRSQCADDPCLNNNCTATQTCFLRRSQCEFNTGCPMEAFCRETVCAETLKMSCPFGFEAVGCPRSVCANDPCLTVRCGPSNVCVTRPTQCDFLSYCPHEAVCEASLCEEVCSKTCPFGFQLEGCPRCECSPDPCETAVCDAGLTCKTVPTVCQFTKDCPHEAICDDTACEATCRKQCEFGFLPSGCPRCECSPDPCVGASCPSGQTCQPKVPPCAFSTGCPAVAHCDDTLCSATCSTKQCDFGFEMTGCPRCTCVQDPCLGHRCPSGAVCESEPGTCVLNNQCPFHAVCKTQKCIEVCSFRTCPFGYLESGCPRCNCAPNPCVSFSCGVGQRCVAVADTCVSEMYCPKRAACVDDAAADPCTLPRDRGTCSESLGKYFYDKALKRCKWFPYSGCGGNANRFDSWFLCMQACNVNGATVGLPV